MEILGASLSSWLFAGVCIALVLYLGHREQQAKLRRQRQEREEQQHRAEWLKANHGSIVGPVRDVRQSLQQADTMLPRIARYWRKAKRESELQRIGYEIANGFLSGNGTAVRRLASEAIPEADGAVELLCLAGDPQDEERLLAALRSCVGREELAGTARILADHFRSHPHEQAMRVMVEVILCSSNRYTIEPLARALAANVRSSPLPEVRAVLHWVPYEYSKVIDEATRDLKAAPIPVSGAPDPQVLPLPSGAPHHTALLPIPANSDGAGAACASRTKADAT